MLHLDLIREPLAGRRPVELVERKGLGHPDTLCDHLAEELSLALSRFYRQRFGQLHHHNVDKALLWAGRSSSAFGGGEVLEPMVLHLAGRATLDVGGEKVPVEELAVEGSRSWLRRHLHALDCERDVSVRCLVRPGSPELVDLFRRQEAQGNWLSNDTSMGVGFAPLSDLESMVYEVEHHLTSLASTLAHPEIGEDVKVMGLRTGESIHLTVACAFVDRHLRDTTDYLEKKERLAADVKDVASRLSAHPVEVLVNGADDPEHDSLYTTVTGTSAESGDDGQAGRGNRANGLITPARPMTLESVAGKNPITHVGKLYNLAASLMADDLVRRIERVDAAECHLLSDIGCPVTRPRLIQVRLLGPVAATLESLRRAVDEVVDEHLSGIDRLWQRLLDRDVAFDRWPLQRPAPDDPTASRWESEEMVREIIDEARFTASFTGRSAFSPAVLEALLLVPRHEFVPEADRHLAYRDLALPIAHGQTISQPYMVALMTDLLDLDASSKVLEVGTGSGYQAAVLAHIARKIYTLELDERLAGQARARLVRLGRDNVTVRAGDGRRGLPEEAPFDAIIVTAAGAEVPRALISQLGPGGRLVIPVERRGGQMLVRILKRPDGTIEENEILPVLFVPLR